MSAILKSLMMKATLYPVILLSYQSHFVVSFLNSSRSNSNVLSFFNKQKVKHHP